jgi:hypothetical protein
MVDVMDNIRDRVSILTRIGLQIESVNSILQSHLNACHECFAPPRAASAAADLERQHRSIQIFAIPFAASVRLDGFCNIDTVPMRILVDVGKVAPPDWLALVAHEYAHAYLGYPGHDRKYAKILTHLCLGLGLAQPDPTGEDRSLHSWPPYTPTIDPLAWWRGES